MQKIAPRLSLDDDDGPWLPELAWDEPACDEPIPAGSGLPPPLPPERASRHGRHQVSARRVERAVRQEGADRAMRPQRQTATSWLMPIALLVTLGLLLTSWHYRDSGITPERGLGYALGIAGGVMLLIVLLYPLRKRVRWLSRLGSVSQWFRLHMALGILTPAVILVHSQFKLGALNSNVALACLLIVSASGLIGRYLYSRIHLGLYGARASLTELLAEAEDLKGAIDMDLGEHGHLWTLLADFERRALTAPRGVVGSMWHRMVIGHQTARSRRRLVAACRSAIARESRQQRWPRARRRQTQAMLRQHLSLYFATIRRAAGLSVYESLFGLWHVLHVPLFMLLVVTAIIHVIAVHLY